MAAENSTQEFNSIIKDLYERSFVDRRGGEIRKSKYLKPCPFCGSDAEMGVSIDYNTMRYAHIWLCCSNSLCEVGWYDDVDKSTLGIFQENYGYMIEQWNSRV